MGNAYRKNRRWVWGEKTGTKRWPAAAWEEAEAVTGNLNGWFQGMTFRGIRYAGAAA